MARVAGWVFSAWGFIGAAFGVWLPVPRFLEDAYLKEIDNA